MDDSVLCGRLYWLKDHFGAQIYAVRHLAMFCKIAQFMSGAIPKIQKYIGQKYKSFPRVIKS